MNTPETIYAKEGMIYREDGRTIATFTDHAEAEAVANRLNLQETLYALVKDAYDNGQLSSDWYKDADRVIRVMKGTP